MGTGNGFLEIASAGAAGRERAETTKDTKGHEENILRKNSFKASVLDSLQVFLGAGVGVSQSQGGAKFFGGGMAVALLFK